MERTGMVRSKSTGSVGLPVNVILSSDPYRAVHSGACRRSSQRSRSQPPGRWSRVTMDIVEGLVWKSLYHPQPGFLGSLTGCERKLPEPISISRRLSAGSCIPPSTDASPVLSMPHARILRVTRRSTPHNSPTQGRSAAAGPDSCGTSMEFPTRRLFGVTGQDPDVPVPQHVEEDDEVPGNETGLIRTSVQAAYDSLSGFLRVGSRKSTEDCCRIEDSGDRVSPSNSQADMFMERSSSNYRHYVELHTDRWGEGSYDKLEVELEGFVFDGNGGCTIS
eukprot:GHVS01071662.1.p1 GENE.GHVS01071662.1~~GHVS01071662.1.p1  ORF type:complete len:277 (+),score=8.37 GHVS01071662.1:473-1303(+)